MIKVASVIGVCIITILLGFGAAKTTFKLSKQGDDLERLKKKTGPATPIKEGVMSEKMKKHSKIFKGFGTATQGKKLRNLAAERGDVNVVMDVGEMPPPPATSLDEYLRRLTCKANAVVIGSIRSKSSNLIEEGTFVFTDYELTVKEILKNNVALPIEAGGVITFTSPGGAVELNGHTIRTLDYRNEPLQASADYLLYLQFIPETNSYKAFSDSMNGDTFQLKGNTVVQASAKPMPFGAKRTANAEAFMSTVQKALTLTCTK